jgi:uncharacterized membrane protein YhaH (DUF805 family)
MTFQESIRVCLTKYAEFRGTASRGEYWWFVLFLALGGSIAAVLDDRLATIFYLVTLLPLLAAGTRRLRETGRSGWLQLIAFVPVAGVIVLAILLSQPAPEHELVRETPRDEQPVGA